MSWEKIVPNSQDIEEDNDDINQTLMPIRLSNNINTYDNYDMYMAHCNFYISYNVALQIATIEGVESIDILSPYRVRISIGKLFEAKPILKKITSKLTS